MGRNFADIIARIFHDTYEQMAPFVGWETQESTKTDWAYLPESNRDLMVAVVTKMLADGIILVGPELLTKMEEE